MGAYRKWGEAIDAEWTLHVACLVVDGPVLGANPSLCGHVHIKLFCSTHADCCHNAHAKFISIRAALYSVTTLSCKYLRFHRWPAAADGAMVSNERLYLLGKDRHVKDHCTVRHENGRASALIRAT